MSENSKTLAEALDGYVDNRLRDVHVAMPGRVESYDSAAQRASVQPLIQRVIEAEDGSRTAQSLPVINDVPVVFPGAGSFSITFPVTRGDTVLLVFSEFSIEKWREQGPSVVGTKVSPVDPEDGRHHALSDCIAIPGLRSFNDATDQVDSSAMVIAGVEIKLGSKDASNEAVGKSDLDALKTAITNTVIVATDGGASFKSTLLAGWTPTGSSVVKID